MFPPEATTAVCSTLNWAVQKSVYTRSLLPLQLETSVIVSLVSIIIIYSAVFPRSAALWQVVLLC